jgi:hypothetical protein
MVVQRPGACGSDFDMRERLLDLEEPTGGHDELGGGCHRGGGGDVGDVVLVSRLAAALLTDEPRALKAIRAALAVAREGTRAQHGRGLVMVDSDATIVIACSEKEQTTPTWRKTFGFRPITGWADTGGEAAGDRAAGRERSDISRRLGLAQLLVEPRSPGATAVS